MFYYPKKLPKRAALTSIALAFAATVVFLLGELFAPRMIFQLVGLFFVSAAIYTVSRYMLTDYKYLLRDIDEKGGEATFSIIRITGKREVVMATFEMKDAYAIEKCKSIRAFEKRNGKVNKVFRYTQNMLSDDRYMIAINFNGMKILFCIELSDEFAHAVDHTMVKTDEIY